MQSVAMVIRWTGFLKRERGAITSPVGWLCTHGALVECRAVLFRDLLALLLGNIPALLSWNLSTLLLGHLRALLLWHVGTTLLGNLVALLFRNILTGLSWDLLTLLSRYL